jgi:hypothetical protein
VLQATNFSVCLLILSVRAGTSKERCTFEVQSCQVCNCFDVQLASPCLAGPEKARERRYKLTPSSKIPSPPNDCSSCDNAVKRPLSTPYRPDKALPSPHNQLHPSSHTYPTTFLASSRCHPPSASASPNHFDRPSSAHDKQSSAAIKPPQGARLSTALRSSQRVSCSDYGRAKSGSRLFISGTIYSNCATYLCSNLF